MFGKKKDDNLIEELAALGRQIKKSVTAAAQSDELKGLGGEVSAGLKKVGDRAAEAIKAAKKSREVRELSDQFKKTAKLGAAAGKEAGGKAYENVAHGLSDLGNELARLAEQLKSRYKK